MINKTKKLRIAIYLIIILVCSFLVFAQSPKIDNKVISELQFKEFVEVGVTFKDYTLGTDVVLSKFGKNELKIYSLSSDGGWFFGENSVVDYYCNAKMLCEEVVTDCPLNYVCSEGKCVEKFEPFSNFDIRGLAENFRNLFFR